MKKLLTALFVIGFIAGVLSMFCTLEYRSDIKNPPSIKCIINKDTVDCSGVTHINDTWYIFKSRIDSTTTPVTIYVTCTTMKGEGKILK